MGSRHSKSSFLVLFVVVDSKINCLPYFLNCKLFSFLMLGSNILLILHNANKDYSQPDLFGHTLNLFLDRRGK